MDYNEGVETASPPEALSPRARAAALRAQWSPVHLHVRYTERAVRRRGLESRVVRVGDATVHYWKGGSGPPLLLLHGFGGDGLFTWRPQIAALMPRRTVIVPDLLWFGRSHARAELPSLAAQVRAVLGLLDHERTGPVDIMGMSYGGFLAFELAALHPDAVRGVVVTSCPGPAITSGDLDDAHTRLSVAHLGDLLLPEHPRGVQAVFDLALHRRLGLPRFVLSDIHALMFATHRAERRALLDELLARRAETVDRDWSAIPLQGVVWGEHDPLFPLPLGERLAARYGTALHVIPRTAHVPNFERPRAYNVALAALYR